MSGILRRLIIHFPREREGSQAYAFRIIEILIERNHADATIGFLLHAKIPDELRERAIGILAQAAEKGNESAKSALFSYLEGSAAKGTTGNSIRAAKNALSRDSELSRKYTEMCRTTELRKRKKLENPKPSKRTLEKTRALRMGSRAMHSCR
ncbi:MAG: hypothetical protein Q7S22_02660 [Candidatus Micrarchaeota archaeon]|nr:hypothetical protein [Candidatus Micrarchaeota archaeon]